MNHRTFRVITGATWILQPILPVWLALAPAAFAVLTREEIRRSGSTTIPDLLRPVRGARVGETSFSVWAVRAWEFA